MKENKHSNLMIIYIIFAIIVILVLIYFVCRFYNEKTEASQKAESLQTHVSELNEKLSNLQGKINSIANTIRTDTKNEITEDIILGTWKASKVVDSDGTDLGLNYIWGTGINYSNEMIFEKNDVLKYRIGITPSDADGKYKINGNTIEYGAPTDGDELIWRSLTYVPEENVLNEEYDENDGKKIVTYVKVK